MGLVTVTVTVPEDRAADLMQYAAKLFVGDTTHPDDDVDWDDVEEAGAKRARPGWGRTAVRNAYLGGVSDVWRPFLEYLADRPDEWVPWSELCEAIDRTPREASGMLGAAERRTGGKPPYEKRWLDGERMFRMPSSVADVINELREE